MRQRPQLDFANWHVTARGSRRLPLFHDDADFRTFYALLGETCGKSGMSLIADCLLSNHFHLALGGSSSALTQCMQRLNRAYSGYHNTRYQLSGHAFEQAYFGEPVPSDFILTRVIRYIHLNPVRAKRVPLPEQYAWSSYRRMINGDVGILTPGELDFLGLFEGDVRQAQSAYRQFTEADLHRRIVVPAGKTTAWEIWQEHFTWILNFLLEHEADIEPLEPELAAAYLGSKIGIPPRVMGCVLGHRDGRQASEMIRTMNRRIEQRPEIQATLDVLNIL